MRNTDVAIIQSYTHDTSLPIQQFTIQLSLELICVPIFASALLLYAAQILVYDLPVCLDSVVIGVSVTSTLFSTFELKKRNESMITYQSLYKK